MSLDGCRRRGKQAAGQAPERSASCKHGASVRNGQCVALDMNVQSMRLAQGVRRQQHQDHGRLHLEPGAGDDQEHPLTAARSPEGRLDLPASARRAMHDQPVPRVREVCHRWVQKRARTEEADPTVCLPRHPAEREGRGGPERRLSRQKVLLNSTCHASWHFPLVNLAPEPRRRPRRSERGP